MPGCGFKPAPDIRRAHGGSPGRRRSSRPGLLESLLHRLGVEWLLTRQHPRLGVVGDDGEGGEGGAAVEGVVAHRGEAGGEGDVGKGGAAVEGTRVDGGDAGGEVPMETRLPPASSYGSYCMLISLLPGVCNAVQRLAT